MSAAPRTLFTVAAAFNALVGLPMLFAYPVAASLLQLQGPPTAWFHIVAGVVLIFGYAYWKIAQDPVAYRAYVVLGVLGKLLFVVVIYGHWLAGDLSSRVAALVTVDLAFAIAFAVTLRRIPLAA